jgi:hypothetical protein
MRPLAVMVLLDHVVSAKSVSAVVEDVVGSNISQSVSRCRVLVPETSLLVVYAVVAAPKVALEV